MSDRIVVRHWPNDPANPIALFMDQPESRGRVNSYMHVGQHGAADPRIVSVTLPCRADCPHALALVAELRLIGYTPRVMRRMQRSKGA